MADPDPSLERSREDSLGRLKAFTDGTVAIALTLLVLPLLDVARDAEDVSVPALVADNAGTFVAFLLSFVVVARLWSVHRRSFAVLRDFDTRIVTWLMVWLLTIVFLPFPTDLLFSGRDLREGSATLYLGTLLAASVAGAVQSGHARRHPELLHPFATRAMMLEARRQGVLALGVLAVCTVVSLRWPQAGLYGLFGLSLADRTPVPGLRERPDAVPLPD